MARRRNDHVHNFLAADQAEMQSKIELLGDAFSLLERTMSKMIDELSGAGHLDPEAPFLAQWKEALSQLRRQGLKPRTLPGEPAEPTVTCPRCDSVLRGKGDRGDRCDWCGHVFPLRCPACNRPQENIRGAPGDLCLWCHHEF